VNGEGRQTIGEKPADVGRLFIVFTLPVGNGALASGLVGVGPANWKAAELPAYRVTPIHVPPRDENP
jgi:hypothetical protein